MGYKKITNLQINHPLFYFKEVYACEKIHGTSCHLTFTSTPKGWEVKVFSGGIKHSEFIFMLNMRYKLFTEILDRVTSINEGRSIECFTIYGEGYGDTCQGMGGVYGSLNFIAFEVCKIISIPISKDKIKSKECWLDVPRAECFVKSLGLPFVSYELGPATTEWLDQQRNKPSQLAILNGMGDDKEGEGIVVRAPIELYDDNGGRLIAKYKREGFREMATPRVLTEVDIKELEDAEEIAEEWVVEERLNHVLSSLVAKGHQKFTLRDTRLVMDAMIEDVSLEAVGQIAWSVAAGKAIGKRAADLFKTRIQTGGITNPIAGV